MAKTWAILIVIGAMAAVYLFLLVGIPALSNMVTPCGSDNVSQLRDTTNVTANWTFVGPPLDVMPYQERFKAPWLLNTVPGLVGITFIVVILRQRRRQSR